MTPATECYPLHPPKAAPAWVAWAWRLLTALPRLIVRRPPFLNPQHLPPHLRRDLGLMDEDLFGRR